MVCFLQCFEIIVVLHRYIFLLSQNRGIYDTEKSVWTLFLDVAYCLARMYKLKYVYFPGVSCRTSRKNFEGFLSFENHEEQKKGGKCFFSCELMCLIYQMSIFVLVAAAIFILENSIHNIVGTVC